MKKIFLLIFFISTWYYLKVVDPSNHTHVLSEDFSYSMIAEVFPDKTLSFKENQKFYESYKRALEKLANNSPTEENWFNLAYFIIDFSEDFDDDMEDASEIINETLDILLEDVKIKDIQSNPSSYSRHMYIMKQFIRFLEYTIYDEPVRVSLFNAYSKSEKSAIFIDKIGLINNYNNILTTTEKNILLKDYVARNLHTPIFELKKTKEHPGVNLFFNTTGLDLNIVQYVFFNKEDSTDNRFQIYLYKTDGYLDTLDQIYHHTIDIELSEKEHPFFFENGKNIIRDKINLYHKYLELDFDTEEFALNFFDILIKPVIEYDKNFLTLDLSMINLIEEDIYLGPQNIFILDNVIAKIPMDALMTSQDYLFYNILPIDLSEKILNEYYFGDIKSVYVDPVYTFHYANTLEEIVKNMQIMSDRIQDIPGYADLMNSLKKKMAEDKDWFPTEDEVSNYMKTLNSRDYIENQKLNINIFSMSNFSQFDNKELKKFNIPKISSLKFVSNEVDAIHKTVKESNNENIKTYDRNSSETFFKNYDFDNEDIIHIATHGFFVEDEVSALIFSPDSDNDGFLTYREIQKLNIDARLVVLSACNTNQGESYDNIHSISIARAFKDIGVQNVIGSLWSIDDEATAKFMEIFYENLMDNSTKSIPQALQRSKINMREFYPNPHYWAGFVLYGFY